MTDLSTLTDAELNKLRRDIESEIQYRAETRHAEWEAKAKADQVKPDKGKGRNK
jgi:hypothetical protein